MSGGQWVSDGSTEIHINGSTVECQSEDSSGNVYNALWKDNESGETSGTHYWKIHFDGNNGPFVGITDSSKFKKGWGCKGLFYGGPGNLSSGGALVTSGYGPKIESGSTVGILVIFQDSNIKLYFDMNGTPLGAAFDLPSTVLNGIFPVVHFSGNGKATIEKCSIIPTEKDRAGTVYEGIEGDWECKQFKGVTPPNTWGSKGPTIGIERNKNVEGESFSVQLKVINSVNYTITRDPDGKWKTDGGMTTLMAGPPELMQLEHQMSSLIASIAIAEADSNGILTISNGDINSKWERYDAAPKVVTESPFY